MLTAATGPGAGGRPRRQQHPIALFAALIVGAGIAAVMMLAAAPGFASTQAPSPPVPPSPTAPPAPSARAAPPAPGPGVTRGVVIAAASCLDPRAHDLVALRTSDGVARQLPLDSCGSPEGAILNLQVVDGDPMVHIAGTGATSRPAGHGGLLGGGSTASQRLEMTLVAVAAVGMAALLVAVGRDRARRRP